MQNKKGKIYFIYYFHFIFQNTGFGKTTVSEGDVIRCNQWMVLASCHFLANITEIRHGNTILCHLFKYQSILIKGGNHYTTFQMK